MYSAIFVEDSLQEMYSKGMSKPDILYGIAKLCVGWPYVFGAWGELCTKTNRGRRMSEAHPTIKSKCQILNGKKTSCIGCKWYPNESSVRMYDCRGFTDWLLNQVGIDLIGGGCTIQWNENKNWAEKGPISEMPKDKVCCVFYGEKVKEHTGMYFPQSGTTVECSNGVEEKTLAKKWTYYAVPAGLYEGDESMKPTLRKGSKGNYVVELQNSLILRGYSLPKYGADGSFGNETLNAVKAFQGDHGIAVDGVVGPETWDALGQPISADLYTVTIPHLTDMISSSLVNEYKDATRVKE